MSTTPKLEPLGINKIESLLYYVHDLEPVRRFFLDQLDFTEIGVSSEEMNAKGRQRSAAFQAGDVIFVICAPIGEGGRASRFLRKHPEGVGTIVYQVDDIERAFRLLDERDGTMITDIQRYKDDQGTLAFFSITTPFGDTTFRFVERKGYGALFPGFVPHVKPFSLEASSRTKQSPGLGGKNVFGFRYVDHLTANFQTLAPALLWLEHVMGLERFWTVQFHTTDVNPGAAQGSGLKSVVMIDDRKIVKFANNEPMRPFFKDSQINIFAEDHRGDGVQHAALVVDDIIATVKALRARGVQFMSTPGAYYDMLPARLDRIGVGTIDEDIETLRELQILVDGEGKGQYMLQIFLKDAASVFGDKAAGPFFFEIIQRKGSESFGAGNFRALFESIERDQRSARTVS